MVLLPAPLFIVPTPADVKSFFNIVEFQVVQRTQKYATASLSGAILPNSNSLKTTLTTSAHCITVQPVPIHSRGQKSRSGNVARLTSRDRGRKGLKGDSNEAV